ncbi:MAG: hypothetical protein RIA08_09910 [Roseovarius sp.]|uniref:hypothetical protein n=1 Tax=Roseovarius sp. TaxID=1486281 RepID=UPI0032F01E9C
MSVEMHTIRIIDNTHKGKPSIWRQTGQVLLLSGILFGPGILADSTAMQWAGFALFLVLALFCLDAWNDSFLTPDKARQKIDEIEKAAAK